MRLLVVGKANPPTPPQARTGLDDGDADGTWGRAPGSRGQNADSERAA